MDFGSATFIIVILLLFVDGLIFGVAATKGLVSILLLVIGLVIAAFIGISIPSTRLGNVSSWACGFK